MKITINIHVGKVPCIQSWLGQMLKVNFWAAHFNFILISPITSQSLRHAMFPFSSAVLYGLLFILSQSALEV